VTLLAHAEDDYTLEFSGHHVGARAAGGLIVPARQQHIACRQIRAHGALDETPDQPRNRQNQTQRLDAFWPLQEQCIDDLIVLEEAEVSLDRVLVFLGL
jgi:hypothetical protein